MQLSRGFSFMHDREKADLCQRLSVHIVKKSDCCSERANLCATAMIIYHSILKRLEWDSQSRSPCLQGGNIINSTMRPDTSRLSVGNLHLHLQSTPVQPQTKLTREVLLFHLSLSFSKLVALPNGLLVETTVRRNTELMNLFFFFPPKHHLWSLLTWVCTWFQIMEKSCEGECCTNAQWHSILQQQNLQISYHQPLSNTKIIHQPDPTNNPH